MISLFSKRASILSVTLLLVISDKLGVLRSFAIIEILKFGVSNESGLIELHLATLLRMVGSKVVALREEDINGEIVDPK